VGENDKRVGKKQGREQGRIERTVKMNETDFCTHGLDPHERVPGENLGGHLNFGALVGTLLEL